MDRDQVFYFPKSYDVMIRGESRIIVDRVSLSGSIALNGL
jgi:hypothetical protein